jgi:hypothetical protein
MPTMAELLRGVAQGASNSAASTVSAPVDAMAWALRKAGIDTGTSVGGSDWMAQKGLTATPTNEYAGLAGEALGNISPIVAAAKAPQIAASLLRGGENLAAPRTLNPQTGAIVYHGSPHKFDAFDASKIGTGEGAQAYGHGLYLADTPAVAQSYKSAGTDASTFVPVRSIRDPEQMAATALARAGGDMRHAQAVLSQNMQSGDMTAGAALQVLKSGAKMPESKYAGSLYKVDLPDEHIAKMLDWDKPLSQQAPEVRDAVLSTKNQLTPDDIENLGGAAGVRALYNPANKIDNFLGTWQSLRGSPDAGESILRQQGIPGIRYLDGNSRGAGTGTSNYVVFPGNEGLLKILERNGVPMADELRSFGAPK